MTRRIAAAIVFAVIAVPAVLVAWVVIACWAAHWILTGEVDDAILLDRRLYWLVDLPWRVAGITKGST